MTIKEQRNDFHRKMKYYEPAKRFMDGGSLYGRSRYSPRTAGRICRIFSTCIRLSFKTNYYWAQTSANERAYNRQTLYPLFAYQLRPVGNWMPRPPRQELHVDIEPEMVWLKAA